MRWVPPAFGPIYWATEVIPEHYTNVSAAIGIRPSSAEFLSPEVMPLASLAISAATFHDSGHQSIVLSRRHQEAEDFALFRDPLRAKLYSPDACRNGHCAEPDEGEQTVYGERSYDHRVASCQADAELACCRQR